MSATAELANIQPMLRKKPSKWRKLRSQKALMVMSIPFLIYVIIFAYVPLYGWIMAFQNYKLGSSMLHNEWVGLANFRELFIVPG